MFKLDPAESEVNEEAHGPSENMISWRAKTQNTIVGYYDKLKKQPNGKLHKVAMIASMNKFLKVAFHLIQNGLLYQYESGKAS